MAMRRHIRAMTLGTVKVGPDAALILGGLLLLSVP